MPKDLTLVIGDAHVAPGQNLRRFKWANQFIRDHDFDRIVVIGDFLTLDCFSEWDKDKRKKMEGRRYEQDVETGREALDLLLDSVTSIPIIFTEGNHEERAKRYIDTHPELEGVIHVETDLFLRQRHHHPITYVPYKEDWTYKGVSFTHAPIQENGKPVAGKFSTKKALALYHNSVVYGHTHKLDLACEHRHNSLHLNQAVNVGCFFEHVDEYAQGSATSYWRGLVLLDHYSFNRVDVSTASLGKLKQLYGGKR